MSSDSFPGERDDLRTSIAAAAARLIAEDGCDYSTAKRKASQEILGTDARNRSMPDNAAVEHELRRYLQLFGSPERTSILAGLRSMALQTMERLAAFDPYLIGAVLNGTATEHSDIHLHLYTDSAKEVEMTLLSLGVEFEVDEPAENLGRAAMEVIRLLIPAAKSADLPVRMNQIGLELIVFERDAIRIAPRAKSVASGLHPVEASGRASVRMLRELLAARE